MTFSYEDMLAVEDVLADALVQVGDEKMKLFTPGWYKRQIKNGLDKLNYSAPFITTFKDIKIPTSLIAPIPSGVFNTIDLFVWNGQLGCDKCKISSVVRLFHKRGLMTKGKDYGYTARHMSHSRDFYISSPQSDNGLFFYNVNMGAYMLSKACDEYENLRIVYNGVPKSVDKVKFIPPFCKEMLEAWVVERAFSAIKAKNPSFRVLHADAHADLFQRRGAEPSKYDKAETLMKRVDTKVWDDISEYLGAMP